MSKPKPFILSLEEMFRKDKIDDWIFMYIHAIRRALPSIQVKQAALLFIEDFGLWEDTMPLENVLMSYYRSQQIYEVEFKKLKEEKEKK